MGTRLTLVLVWGVAGTWMGCGSASNGSSVATTSGTTSSDPSAGGAQGGRFDSTRSANSEPSRSGGGSGDLSNGGSGGNASVGMGSKSTSKVVVAGGIGGASHDTTASLGGSSASSGAAGQTGTPGAHCTPGTLYSFPQVSDVTPSCYMAPETFELTNPGAVIGVRAVNLPAPMIPNQPYAVSQSLVGHGPLNLELWGTDSECGKAAELLWWGPMQAGIVCAEFTPTMGHSHLLGVLRLLTEQDYLHYVDQLGLCQGGTCPAGSYGHGREPGKPLSSPFGEYVAFGSGIGNNRTTDILLQGGGNITLMYPTGLGDLSVGKVKPLTHGVFRMPAADHLFSDAWYCVGADSSITRVDANRTAITLKNITRLADCASIANIGSSSISITNAKASVTSALSALTGSDFASVEKCNHTECRLSFSRAPQFTWLRLKLDADVGYQQSPTLTPAGLTEAYWFEQADESAPIRMACGTQGSFKYDPAATSTISLTQTSDFVSCPGEPIANDTFELIVR